MGENFILIDSAFKSRLQTYAAKNLKKGDLKTVLQSLSGDIIAIIKKVLMKQNSVKFNLFVECLFENVKKETSVHNFKSKNEAIFQASDVADIVNKHICKIIVEFEESNLGGSGLYYLRVHSCELRINENVPLSGRGYLQLPKKFENCKSLINIRNFDDYCFKYCVLSQFIEENKDLMLSYLNRPDLESKYDWSCVNFPVEIKDIAKFEKVNSMSINVFSVEQKFVMNVSRPYVDYNVYPIKVCEKELPDHRDLLYVTDDEGDSHYLVITDFNKFIRPFLTTFHKSIKVCKRCFSHFSALNGKSAQERLNYHLTMCSKIKPVRSLLPQKQEVCFNQYHHSKKIRFVIYADFECVLHPISHCQNNVESSWTTRYQKHEPFSFCYLLKDSENEYTQLRLFRGQDAAEQFMRSLTDDVKKIEHILFGNNKPIKNLTPVQQKAYESSTICHICKKGDFTVDNYKVKDHCHITGDYRGAAHNNCNLLFKRQTFIPVIIHNLSGYDSHFIIKQLGYDESRINVICNTKEKYISFSKFVTSTHLKSRNMELRFIDSFRFMPNSLQQLADNLPKNNFFETKEHFGDKYDLVNTKGVFPYDFVTDYDVLNSTSLPPKENFFNKLNGEHISDGDYAHAQKVWDEFKINNLGEYSDVYLKSDTLILSDVFENFRGMCLQTYDLDCLHYFTAPGFAYSAMLKYTGVKLPLLMDIDMLLLVERGVRGGICQCVTRYAEANNHMCDDYDACKRTSFLYYLDANNLYGYAMSQRLPCGNFKWLTAQEIQNIDITTMVDDYDKGYILEVDIEYPHILHDKHEDLPFCAEMKHPPNSKSKKLLTTLDFKLNYVAHYSVLKQAMRYGLKITKIHRGISFDQSSWLQPYIELNSNKRMQAKNEFEKNFFKLMNNAVFGKTMENVRKRIDFRLVSDERRTLKLISKPNFVDRVIYTPNLVGIELLKTNLVLDKAIYVGMCILDISKVLMYDFHYDKMQKIFDGDLKLCYMDTDSFIYKIYSDDLYADLQQAKQYLDTSVYEKDHALYCTTNKAVVGKFKDECPSGAIQKFVGLRAKMYALKLKCGKSIKKLKGINKNVIKNSICFEDYVNCLENNTTTFSLNRAIRSFNHEVYSVCINKKTLNAEDDKRVILDDGINTVPHGHYMITECDNVENHKAKRCKIN